MKQCIGIGDFCMSDVSKMVLKVINADPTQYNEQDILRHSLILVPFPFSGCNLSHINFKTNESCDIKALVTDSSPLANTPKPWFLSAFAVSYSKHS